MLRLPLSTESTAALPLGQAEALVWSDMVEAAAAACGAASWLLNEQANAIAACDAAIALIAEEWVETLPWAPEIEAPVTDAEMVCASDFALTVSPLLLADSAAEATQLAIELASDQTASNTAQHVIDLSGSSQPGGTVSARSGFDIEDSDDDEVPSLPKLTLRRFAGVVGGLLGLGAVAAVAVAPATDIAPPSIRLVVEQVALAAPVSATEDRVIAPVRISQSEVVNRGETVSSLLSRLGANDPQLVQFVSTDRVARRLMQLQPGRTVSAEIDDAGVVHRLQYRHGNLEIDGRLPLRVTIARENGQLSATEQPVAVDRGIEARSAEIRTTLFAATDSAGIPDAVATRAADILSNSIDLRKDLQRGARLRVVYETLREADSLDLPVPGRVLAIELESGSLRHEAVWFEHDDGRGAYYNFAGQSLVRSFLREPIQYTRITSGFSGARLHPLFRDVRAHTGTDFAAPVGTKVRSVADGVVDFAGYNGGYGRTVIISHSGRITTLYAHLNNFGDGISKGARVTQGQVIGTVGMTGWTTGPHLHYEFQVGGRHVDPMRAVLPEGRKLSMSERMRFAPLAEVYREHMAQITGSGSTALAHAKFE